MIRALVRHDQSVRLLWLTVPLAALLGAAVAVAFGEHSAHRIVSTTIADAPDRAVLVGQLTLTLGLWQFLLAEVYLRAHPHHLGLPLSTRLLWGARMIAITVGTMVPAAIGLATYFLVNGNGWGSPHVEIGLNFAAVFAVAPFLYQCRPARSCRADDPHRVLHWIAFALVLLAAELLVAIHRPPFAVVGPAALATAGALGAVTYHRLPRTFEVARRARRAAGSGARPWRRWRFLELPIVSPFAPLNRALRLNWIMTLNMVSLCASSLAYVNVALAHGRHVELFLLAVFQALFFGISLITLPLVAHLPISRTRLFAQCYGPGLVLAIAAAATGLRADRELALGDVLASRAAAAGFATYVAIQFLGCAACLVYLLPPARTARGRRRGLLARHAVTLAAVAAFVLALRPAFQGLDAPARSTGEIYGRLASWGPQSATAAWIGALALAGASIVGLRVLFGRIEYTWLRTRMRKWLDKFA